MDGNSRSALQPAPFITLDAKKKWVLGIIGPLLSIPPVSVKLFDLSLIISLLITIVLSFNHERLNLFVLNMRNKSFDRVFTSMYFDPMLLAIVVMLITSILIVRMSKRVSGAKVWSMVAVFFLPFILFLVVAWVGDLVIKPVFLVDRPPEILSEPPLTSWIRSKMGEVFEMTESNSMPSGHVMRQVSLFYFLTWMVVNKRASKYLSLWLRISIELFNIAVLLFVCFSRVYLSSHTFLDVSIAIGVGTILFWIITMPFYNLITVKGYSVKRVYLSALMAACLILFGLVLGFSKNPSAMIRLMGACVVLLGGLFAVSPAIKVINIHWSQAE